MDLDSILHIAKERIQRVFISRLISVLRQYPGSAPDIISNALSVHLSLLVI